MTNDSTALWGIHGGKTGDADTLFLKKNVVALGWQNIGDLSDLPSERNAFKLRYEARFPDSKARATQTNANQLFRFIHEMRIDDYIAYPSKQDRQIYLGQVTSYYVYEPSIVAGYPHHRSVKWLGSFPRTRLTQGALYSIGSAMSFFNISEYLDEYLVALQMRPSTAEIGEEDETIAPIATNIKQTTRDFILKRLSQELKGHPFEHFIAHLLETMGYRTRVSPEGADGGVDVIAHRDELGFEPPIIKVQAKSGDNTISLSTVQALYGNISSSNEYALFVTLSQFSSQAISFSRGKSNLRLISGDELVEIILDHYEQLDARYKSILPLKKVYIPEVPVDTE